VVGEVLELHDHAGEHDLGRLDELFEQLVVRGPREAPLVDADVQRIVQQGLVVGADVEHDRQAAPRMQAGERRVQRELADWDPHAVRAEVAEPEDALAVGHHDHGGLAARPVAHHLRDAAAVLRRDEHAARAPVDVPVVLAGEADRRRVDDRHQLFRVLHDHPEEQRLVAVLQRLDEDVLRERRLQPVEVLEHPLHLQFLRADVRRQQAAQAECIAFLFGERRALGELRVAQQRGAAWEPIRHRRKCRASRPGLGHRVTPLFMRGC